MKPDEEPWQLERLSAEEAPELHRALGLAKQRLPSSAELAALAASLSGVGLPLLDSAPSVPKSHLTLHAWKYGVIAGAALLGVSALVATRPRAPAAVPAPSPFSARASETPRATSDDSRAAPARALPAAQADANASASPHASTSAAPLANEVPPSPVGGQPPSARQAGNTEEAPLGAPSRPRAPAEPSDPPARAVNGARAALPATSDTQGERAQPSTRAVPSEVELLREARLALQSSPALALGLTEQHSAVYSRGAMAQERELIAISALARLGRRSAVLSRAQRFDQDFPNSPYRAQIARLAR